MKTWRSLMGIFDVNMPLLYGEGLCKAFDRLQDEILKHSDDQSLFAWSRHANPERAGADRDGLLAQSPLDFRLSGDVALVPQIRFEQNLAVQTSNGLAMKFLTTFAIDKDLEKVVNRGKIIVFDCQIGSYPGFSAGVGWSYLCKVGYAAGAEIEADWKGINPKFGYEHRTAVVISLAPDGPMHKCKKGGSRGIFKTIC